MTGLRRGAGLTVLLVSYGLCAFSLPVSPVCARDWSYFVIPAIGTSKNDGTDVGVIAPFIFASPEGRVYQIVAPMYVNNEFLGSRVTLNLFNYPQRGQELNLIGSFTEKIERKLIGSYRNLYMGQGQYSLEVSGGFFKNATARFFGVGANAPEANETNYTDRELYVLISAGMYVGPGQRILVTERLRNVDVQEGGVPDVRSTLVVFPTVKGVTGATIWGHRLGFLSDSRDDSVTPTIGSYFAAFAELAQSFTSGTATLFSKYGIEFRKLLPNETKRYTFTFRGRLESTVNGDEVPFYERALLGGQNSLRGFGVGRFVDDHSILFNFEERIQLFHLRVFGTIAEVETAPFLDIGKVTNKLGERLFANYEFNPGIGFRAIARPNVVGRVDVATSKDGSAVFAGLDFPF